MLASNVVLVNAETNMTEETNPVGADAIMWTPPICQEENGDCLFAYVTPKPKRVVASCASPVMEVQADEIAEDDARFAEAKLLNDPTYDKWVCEGQQAPVIRFGFDFTAALFGSPSPSEDRDDYVGA